MLVFSVGLYLMLLPPYPCSTQVSIRCQLVLEDMLEDMLEFSFYHRCYLLFHILTNTKSKHVTSTYYHC